MRGRVFVDIEKCLSCKRCKIQCAVTHSESGNLYEAIFEDPPPRPRVRVEVTKRGPVPVSCRQCEAAACMMVCPSGAISRSNSKDPVVIDQNACIGCRSCVVVCPYGVPEMNQARSSIAKCDLCLDRLDNDQVPACVEACKPGALTFQKEDEEGGTYVAAWNKRPNLEG